MQKPQSLAHIFSWPSAARDSTNSGSAKQQLRYFYPRAIRPLFRRFIAYLTTSCTRHFRSRTGKIIRCNSQQSSVAFRNAKSVFCMVSSLRPIISELVDKAWQKSSVQRSAEGGGPYWLVIGSLAVIASWKSAIACTDREAHMAGAQHCSMCFSIKCNHTGCRN